MAKLTSKQRGNLPKSAFAGPGRSFPIPDKAHAKAAIMDSKFAPPAARARIVRKAEAKLKK